MNTNNKETPKKKYRCPEITKIIIDKDVSVLMSSSNPFHDPEEESIHEPFNSPFKLTKL